MSSVKTLVPRTSATARILGGMNIPSDLGNLVFWYATDRSVTGVANGGAISTCNDLSGNNNTLTAATTARPTYITNAYNGLPCMRFDGVANVLAAASSSAQVNAGLSRSSLTCFAVVKETATANTCIIFSKDDSGLPQRGPMLALDPISGSDARAWYLTANAAAGNVYRAHGDQNISGVTAIITSTFIQSSVAAINTNNTANSITTDAAGSGVFAGNTTVFRIGGNAASNVVTNFFVGDIMECGAYSGKLALAQLVALTNYLSAKWGVSIA